VACGTLTSVNDRGGGNSEFVKESSSLFLSVVGATVIRCDYLLWKLRFSLSSAAPVNTCHLQPASLHTRFGSSAGLTPIGIFAC